MNATEILLFYFTLYGNINRIINGINSEEEKPNDHFELCTFYWQQTLLATHRNKTVSLAFVTPVTKLCSNRKSISAGGSIMTCHRAEMTMLPLVSFFTERKMVKNVKTKL